ncbi:MAG: YIP1 family protein [bacterium]
MHLSQILYDLITNPKEGIERFRTLNNNTLIAIVTVAVVIISQGVARGVISPPRTNFITFALSFGLAGKFLFTLLFWFSVTAVFHIFASWGGGLGKARELFALLGQSSLVILILLPIAIITKILGPAGYMLFILCYLVTIGWLVSLQIRSIKAVYSSSTEKAILIYLTPALIIAALVSAAFILGIGSVAFLIASNL